MATTKIQVVQNDNNHKLIFTIRKDGRIESLLGATIQLQFINRQNGNVMKRECTVTDAAAAECMYVLVSDDLAEVGSYITELTISYANGTKLTKQNPIVLVVLPEIVSG